MKLQTYVASGHSGGTMEKVKRHALRKLAPFGLVVLAAYKFGVPASAAVIGAGSGITATSNDTGGRLLVDRTTPLTLAAGVYQVNSFAFNSTDTTNATPFLVSGAGPTSYTATWVGPTAASTTGLNTRTYATGVQLFTLSSSTQLRAGASGKIKYNNAAPNNSTYQNSSPTPPASAGAAVSVPTGNLTRQYAFGIDVTAVNTVSLSSTPTNTNLTDNTDASENPGSATAGNVHYNPATLVSEVDGLTSNQSRGSATVDADFSGTIPVYVMFWTTGTLTSPFVITNGTQVTSGSDYTNYQAAYGSSGIAGQDFSYLFKFTTNPFAGGSGAVNWDFRSDSSGFLVDRIAIAPEPTSLGVVGVGATRLLMARRRRATRTKGY